MRVFCFSASRRGRLPDLRDLLLDRSVELGDLNREQSVCVALDVEHCLFCVLSGCSSPDPPRNHGC